MSQTRYQESPTGDDSDISPDRLTKLLVNKQTRWRKRLAVFALLVLVVFLIVLVTPIINALSKITVSNMTGFSPLLRRGIELKGEGQNRINIVILGMGGVGHKGGLLTDTIITASLDPFNKQVAFLTIPRDMVVNYPKPLTGSGKINNIYSLAEQSKKFVGGGPAGLKKALETVLDIPIHYFFQVDFEGFRKVVDALGGITLEVERDIYDPLYPADNMVDFEPFSIKAGSRKLDGETALKYARSRHGSNGEGSDFARSRRQIQVIQSVKEKTLSSRALVNPKKLVELASVAGDHIRTDLTLLEIERLVELVKDIEPKNIIIKVLDSSINSPLQPDLNDNRAYLLVPKLGFGNYKEIQRIAHEIFTDPALALEKASLEVIDSTGQPGASSELIKDLKSFGYALATQSTGPTVRSKTLIVDHTGGKKPRALEFLAKMFQVGSSVDSPPEVRSKPVADLTIDIGQDALALSQSGLRILNESQTTIKAQGP